MEAMGAAVGATKVALQVISNQKRPSLQVYTRLVNTFGPEVDLNNSVGEYFVKYRNQNVGLEPYLVNIGGTSAENVELIPYGEFDRDDKSRSIKNLGVFCHTIPIVPPGQSIFLMTLNQSDLYDYSYVNHVGRPVGITNKTLLIKMTYNGRRSGFNRILRMISDWRCRKQYNEDYLFIPKLFAGDLPLPEYP